MLEMMRIQIFIYLITQPRHISHTVYTSNNMVSLGDYICTKGSSEVLLLAYDDLEIMLCCNIYAAPCHEKSNFTKCKQQRPENAHSLISAFIFYILINSCNAAVLIHMSENK